MKGREVDVSWHICMCEAFKTSVSYSMPLKIWLNYSEQELKYKYVEIARRGWGHCSPFSTPFAAACIPSPMPREQSHSCTAFPSTLWLHPGLTFAQKIQNIWISSTVLYAMLLIPLYSQPEVIKQCNSSDLDAWSNGDMTQATVSGRGPVLHLLRVSAIDLETSGVPIHGWRPSGGAAEPSRKHPQSQEQWQAQMQAAMSRPAQWRWRDGEGALVWVQKGQFQHGFQWQKTLTRAGPGVL